MSKVEVIVALLPDERGRGIARNLNRNLEHLWDDGDEPPINLCGARGEPNSIPHITMFQAYTDDARLEEMKRRMDRIAQELGEDFQLRILLAAVQNWRSGWMFWFPDQELLARNKAWRRLRHLVLDDDTGLGGLPQLRTRSHPLHDDASPVEQQDLERYGYAFVNMPHITVGAIRPGADLPTAFPTRMEAYLNFPSLVLAGRGPRGTIADIFYEVRLSHRR